MGKIRIKTLGDIEAEKKQKEEARKRTETKRVEKKTEELSKPAESLETKPTENIAEKTDKTKKVSKYKAKKNKSIRSQKYQKAISLIDKSKTYTLKEALEVLPKLQLTKLDESVELHINTIEKGISGNVSLPHGTGKKTRIEIANYSENPKAVDELINKVTAGKIDFEILLATPDSMPRLAKIARFLGPKGLMPNPKNGTVTANPAETVKKYEGGQIYFKTESKFPIIHMLVGKISFGQEKLSKNITTAVNAVQIKNIKNMTLKSTMSPGLKIDLQSVN